MLTRFVTGVPADAAPLLTAYLMERVAASGPRRLLRISGPSRHRSIEYELFTMSRRGWPPANARHVLGAFVRGLNRHDGRLGGDTVDADVVLFAAIPATCVPW